MKKAFTLAEALITMGIIGVVAALILPAINNLRPDETKSNYLQTFDSLQDTVLAFAHNTDEYPVCSEYIRPDDGRDNVAYQQNPLLNIDNSNENSVSGRVDNNYQGATKLCNLIAWGLGVEQGAVCNGESLRIDPNNGNIGAMGNVSFTTKNGVDWTIRPYRVENNGLARSHFGYNVLVDVNGASGPNCSYDAETCTQPDKFWFMITADGKVTPADPMGQAYLETRKSIFRKNIAQIVATKQGFTWVDMIPSDNQVTTSAVLPECATATEDDEEINENPVEPTCDSPKEWWSSADAENKVCLDPCNDGQTRSSEGTCVDQDPSNPCEKPKIIAEDGSCVEPDVSNIQLERDDNSANNTTRPSVNLAATGWCGINKYTHKEECYDDYHNCIYAIADKYSSKGYGFYSCKAFTYADLTNIAYSKAYENTKTSRTVELQVIPYLGENSLPTEISNNFVATTKKSVPKAIAEASLLTKYGYKAFPNLESMRKRSNATPKTDFGSVQSFDLAN